MGIWYSTREDVKRALDIAETARSNGQVDRAINSASRSVEGLLKRKFYPWTGTRYFDWPDRRRSRTWRLWLNGDELVSVSNLVAGGVTLDPADYFLEPANDGPPFNRIEVDLASSASFQSGDTYQRAIAVTGVFCGCALETAPAGALEAAISDTTGTVVDVTDSAAIGVGNIILVDSERMTVTDKTMLDTGQDLDGNLTEAKNDVSVPVADGTAYNVDEIILVDSERMLIVDIAGDTLTVKRAWDGSVLASHTTGADIYAPRRLTVERGVLGTTAATHGDTTAISRHVVPGLVHELCVAESLNTIQQEQSGYARTFGSGESERLVGGRGLSDIRAEARQRYGRKARTGAV